jgi:hypothetical protein
MHTASILTQLFEGNPVAFDAEFHRRLRGPAGAELRRAHLLEELATRVFHGDYDQALRSMNHPYPELDHKSLREAADTHEGMVQAKALIARLANPRPRGVAALVEGLAARQRREFDVLMDLLQAAWGFDDVEFEKLLHADEGWLRAWRNHEVSPDHRLLERASRLLRLHEAFRLVLKPGGYAAAWRQRGPAGRLIGQQSAWQAYLEVGDAALDIIESHYAASAGSASL